MAELLEPEGVFLLECFVPDLGRFDRGQCFRTLGVGDDHVRLEASRHDPVHQVVDSSVIRLAPCATSVLPVRLRYAWPAELDLMARAGRPGAEAKERRLGGRGLDRGQHRPRQHLRAVSRAAGHHRIPLDLARRGGPMIPGIDAQLTIGEFAARCGLSAKVLRTYADLGLLVPSTVDRASGYRYYDADLLAEATTVVLLRRAGIPLADIAEFLAGPSGEQLDGWEQSLRAEVHARRDALAEVRARLGLGTARTRGATMVEIRPVEDRGELGRVFDLLGAQGTARLDTNDFRFADLDAHFPHDQTLMLVASTEGQPVGGALAFRNDDGVVVLRIIAVVEAFRHRGIGRRLVERLESEARILGAERIGHGTDEAVGFWFHLGYTPNLLFQWAYDRAAHEEESELLLAGPLSGLRHWRSSFNDVPQLFVELDEPRLDLLASVSGI